jgi:hypothetical protein
MKQNKAQKVKRDLNFHLTNDLLPVFSASTSKQVIGHKAFYSLTEFSLNGPETFLRLIDSEEWL